MINKNILQKKHTIRTMVFNFWQHVVQLDLGPRYVYTSYLFWMYSMQGKFHWTADL